MRSIIAMALYLIVSLLISCEVMSLFVGQTFAVVDNFTHAVLDETFGWPS